MTFENKVNMVLEELKHTLVSKNKKYGNSALDPVRVFSKASPKEQILVRLDDKLSRLRTQHVSEDEDVITDLMGYLVLLRLADMQEPEPTNTSRTEDNEDSFTEPSQDEVIEILKKLLELAQEGKLEIENVRVNDNGHSIDIGHSVQSFEGEITLEVKVKAEADGC